MKHLAPSFSRMYQAVLCSCLDQGALPDPPVIEKIGSKIRSTKVSMLDFAKLHEHILVMKVLPECPMRERVEMVGGRFEIEASPGKVTKVITRVPFGKHIGNKRS